MNNSHLLGRKRPEQMSAIHAPLVTASVPVISTLIIAIPITSFVPSSGFSFSPSSLYLTACLSFSHSLSLSLSLSPSPFFQSSSLSQQESKSRGERKVLQIAYTLRTRVVDSWHADQLQVTKSIESTVQKQLQWSPNNFLCPCHTHSHTHLQIHTHTHLQKLLPHAGPWTYFWLCFCSAFTSGLATGSKLRFGYVFFAFSLSLFLSLFYPSHTHTHIQKVIPSRATKLRK